MAPGAAIEPALQTCSLACVRGRRTLFEQVSVKVARGEILRVEGANGAGKTSLLRLLAGLGQPHAGEVQWQGLPIGRQREAYAQQLLYLGHLVGMKDELTALENLSAEHDLSGGQAAAQDIEQALVRWGLAPQLNLPLRVLSAGQRRRVALARLVLSDAPLWILDEPFTALDVQAVAQLGQIIDQHLARGGLAVVTSHQPLPVSTQRLQTLRLDS